MIKLLVLSLLVASTANASKVVKSETNTLELAVKDQTVEIKLPDVAFKVLNQWNPEFTPYSLKDYSVSILELMKDINPNQVPMAFIEDLDGNDKKDIVIFGADLKKQYVVALLQRDKKWTLIKVAQMSIPNIKSSIIPSLSSATTTTKETGVPVYVLPAEGEQAEKLKEKKKIGIQVETYLGAGEVYEINNNKAVKFTL